MMRQVHALPNRSATLSSHVRVSLLVVLADRVAHKERARYVRCVMRNRWFVIRDHLRMHAHRYRFILMADVRDVLFQANPFAWAPHIDAVSGEGSVSGLDRPFDLHRSVILSGEGSGVREGNLTGIAKVSHPPANHRRGRGSRRNRVGPGKARASIADQAGPGPRKPTNQRDPGAEVGPWVRERDKFG